jgi:rRNA maturation endonuclease Nob1
MSDDGAPKSAYELAMARLRQKDREAGVEEKPVSEEQKAEIAEVRRTYEARLAEREILHQGKRIRARDPEELEKLEEEYRRDRERLASERDRKVEEARRRAS